MKFEVTKPRLFGVKHSNRDFNDDSTWGKNQFNTSFPVGLICYMDSKNINPVYLKMNEKCNVIHDKIDSKILLGAEEHLDNLFFSFETEFQPYQDLVIGNLPRIDLVTMLRKKSNRPLSGLEIKLTALPDESTYSLSENRYSSELVIRPDTIVYLALSIIRSHLNKDDFCFDSHLEKVDELINDWTDIPQVGSKIDNLITILDDMLVELMDFQVPLLIQPIWKTIGKSTILAEDCLDTFVWSNIALTRLFVDPTKRNFYRDSNKTKPTRQGRTVVWLIKMLYDYYKNEKVNFHNVIDELSYFVRNDKAFSSSGRLTYPYLKSDELKSPRIKKNEISEIILGGAHQLLSPERRFDAALVDVRNKIFEF